jgi:hypothetical protein
MYRPHTDSEVSTSSAQAAMAANRPSYTATATRGLGGMIGAGSAGLSGSSAGKKGPVPPSGPKPAGYTVSRGSSPTMAEATRIGDVAAPRAAAAAAAVSAVSPSPPSYRVPPPPPPPQGSRSQSPAAGATGGPGGGGTERIAASDDRGTLQDTPAAGLRTVSARSSTGPFRSKAPPPAPVRPVSQQSDGNSRAGSDLSRPSSVALNFRRSNHAATLSSLGCAYDSSDSEDGGGPNHDDAGSGAAAALDAARGAGVADGDSSAGSGAAIAGDASDVNSVASTSRGNPPPTPLNRGPSARLLIDREEDWRGGPAQASSPMASVAAARAAIPSLVSVSRGLQERAAPIVAAKAAVGAHLQARFPAKSAAARLQGMQADSGHAAGCAAAEAPTASARSDPCVCRGGAAASATTPLDCVCGGGSEHASRSASPAAAARVDPHNTAADGVTPSLLPMVPKPPRRNTLTGSLSRPEAEGLAAAATSGEMLPSTEAAPSHERSVSVTGSL